MTTDPPGTLLDSSARALIEAIGRPTPVPAAGCAAAISGAMAAALVQLAAGVPPRWEGAVATEARARALAARLTELADADAAACHAVLEAVRAASAENRARVREEALVGAARPPLEIAEAAAEVACLARTACEHSIGPARHDAEAAVTLAAAAADAAVLLVRANLAARPDTALLARAEAAVQTARSAAGR